MRGWGILRKRGDPRNGGMILKWGEGVDTPLRTISHLNCTSNQMTGFYLKCSTGRKWVKKFPRKILITQSLVRLSPLSHED